MKNLRNVLRIATWMVAVIGFGLATHAGTSTRAAAQVHYHEHHDLWFLCWCSGDCGSNEECCLYVGGDE